MEHQTSRYSSKEDNFSIVELYEFLKKHVGKNIIIISSGAIFNGRFINVEYNLAGNDLFFRVINDNTSYWLNMNEVDSYELIVECNEVIGFNFNRKQDVVTIKIEN